MTKKLKIRVERIIEAPHRFLEAQRDRLEFLKTLHFEMNKCTHEKKGSVFVWLSETSLGMKSIS